MPGFPPYSYPCLSVKTRPHCRWDDQTEPQYEPAPPWTALRARRGSALQLTKRNEIVTYLQRQVVSILRHVVGLPVSGRWKSGRCCHACRTGRGRYHPPMYTESSSRRDGRYRICKPRHLYCRDHCCAGERKDRSRAEGINPTDYHGLQNPGWTQVAVTVKVTNFLIPNDCYDIEHQDLEWIGGKRTWMMMLYTSELWNTIAVNIWVGSWVKNQHPTSNCN